MKKTINGKKYDTETAEYINAVSNGDNAIDFNYSNEILYRKKTGEFFLYGEGGPRSKYAHYIGGNLAGEWWERGEEIIPFSTVEAKEWLKRYSTAEICEKIFGEGEK